MINWNKIEKIQSEYRSDIKLFVTLIKMHSGKIFTYEKLFREAKELRVKHPFLLKPFSELSPKNQKNFENRLARFLSGTKESLQSNDSVQSKIFNIENIIGEKCSDWVYPINPIERLSPQIKKEGQKFRLPEIS